MEPYTLLWLGWGVYFLIVEGFALYKSKPGSTLSAHIWAWFGTDPKHRRNHSVWMWIRRVALGTFLLWLVVHFLTGGLV